jgi:subtilase family serine protease
MYKFLILCFISTSVLSTNLVKISSTKNDLLKQATMIKALPPQKKLKLMIQLKLRHKHQLKQLAEAVYDPNSPDYQQFLTKARYEQEFAPSIETEKAVADYFSSQGLKTQIKNHLIYVTAEVAQIEQAFKIKLNYYQYKNATIYANAQAVVLDEKIAKHIVAIFGLNTIPTFQENNSQTPEEINFIWQNFKPKALPTDTSISGFTGAQLQQTYQLNKIPTVNGTIINGQGQTLVIVDRCASNSTSDILDNANEYFSSNSITPFTMDGPTKNFSIIYLDKVGTQNCPGAGAYSREIDLDVQAAHTLAPGGNTVLVLGLEPKATLSTVIRTLINNRFTIDGFSNAYVISNSWSGPESYDSSLEDNLLLAASSGISVDFSSGDCGDNTYEDNGKCQVSYDSPIVNYPSSSAYVTAVGASAIFVDNSYNYAFETVWGSIYSDNTTYNFGGGTGGGISRYYGPVAWQKSIRDYSAGGYGTISSKGYRRALPDISMLGDPGTGLLIYTTASGSGEFVKDGGTSLACPLFSATLMMVNQARALLRKSTPIGQAAPYLYQQNQRLLSQKALNVIMPPTQIISGASAPPVNVVNGIPVPASAFTTSSSQTFGWDSSLTIEPESQFWNDAVGVGSPYLPRFVLEMANM